MCDVMYKTCVSLMESNILLLSLSLLSSQTGFCVDHISALVLLCTST